MNILHLPNNIGGVPWALAESERALGHKSKVLNLGENSFGYKADEVLIYGKASRASLLASSLKAFLAHRNNYDVYHFNFGSSLIHAPAFGLNLTDLPFYNHHAKKVFTFSGCDARQKYPTMERVKTTRASAACNNIDCYKGACNSGKRDDQRKRAIEKAAKYSDHFFALNPDLLHFLPAEMSSFCPYVIPDFHSIPSKSNAFFKNDKIHFVHAPTDRAAKGTDVIISAIAKLQDHYPGQIQFTLVENQPRDQALSIYRSADMLIDQLMIGWYGGVAVEAMKMGIPVACYIEESDLHFIPTEMAGDLPIYRVTELDLFHRLEKLVLQREQLPELALLARDFVEKWHQPKEISRNMLKIYSNS